MTSSPKRAALYARCASVNEQRQFTSIDQQLTEGREMADRCGMEVVGMYSDWGLAGEALDRPAFAALKEFVAREQIGTVICTDMLRLARDSDLAWQAVLQLQRCGADVALSGPDVLLRITDEEPQPATGAMR